MQLRAGAQQQQARLLGLARTVHMHHIYDRVFGDFPANNTVYTPYIYMVLANPHAFLLSLFDCCYFHKKAYHTNTGHPCSSEQERNRRRDLLYNLHTHTHTHTHTHMSVLAAQSRSATGDVTCCTTCTYTHTQRTHTHTRLSFQLRAGAQQAT